jgi:hypothetical protein
VRLVALALLALALTGFQSGGGRQRGGTCPSNLDHGSKLIEQPQSACCGTSANCPSGQTPNRPRWNISRIATTANDTWIVTLGHSEITILDTNPVIPPINNVCFALSVAGGDESGANLKKYLDELTTQATAAGVTLETFYDFRPDLWDRYEVATDEVSLGAFNGAWVLRKDNGAGTGRTFSTVATWLSAARTDDAERQGLGCLASTSPWACCTGLGTGTCTDFSWCRATSSSTEVYNPLDIHDSSTSDSGCDDDEGDYLWKPLLDGFEANLGERSVKYMFSRSGNTQQLWHPHSVLADLANSSARTFALEQAYENAIVGIGVTGLELGNKFHFYRGFVSGDVDAMTNVQFWPDMGDGVGGLVAYNGVCQGGPLSNGGDIDASGRISSLAEMALCDAMFDGPVYRSTGATYTYPDYVLGETELARSAFSHSPRVPYMMRVNANWYAGCSASWTVDSDYTDASCAASDALFDDPATVGVNEAALIREMVQKSTRLVIPTSGANTTTDPISQSGLSGNQLVAMISGGVNTPPAANKIVVYDSAKPRAIPPALCSAPSDPAQTPIP